jgi:hypothetical protein
LLVIAAGVKRSHAFQAIHDSLSIQSLVKAPLVDPIVSIDVAADYAIGIHEPVSN